MPFKEIIAVYSNNNTNPINTLYGQNAELLNINVCGVYKYHSHSSRIVLQCA
jgi:hypothetical protein